MISLPYEPSFDDDAGDGSSSPGGRLGVFNRLELPVGTFISGVVLRGWEPSGYARENRSSWLSDSGVLLGPKPLGDEAQGDVGVRLTERQIISVLIINQKGLSTHHL